MQTIGKPLIRGDARYSKWIGPVVNPRNEHFKNREWICQKTWRQSKRIWRLSWKNDTSKARTCGKGLAINSRLLEIKRCIDGKNVKRSDKERALEKGSNQLGSLTGTKIKLI